MAFSKRTINREAVIRFDDNGAFLSAYRLPIVQGLEDDIVFAEKQQEPVPLTLAQVKTYVAAL